MVIHGRRTTKNIVPLRRQRVQNVSVLRALLLILLGLPSLLQGQQDVALNALVSLSDPVKLATLKGERPANTRVRKIVYWLESARINGSNPETIMAQAMALHAWTGEKGHLTTAAMVRNRLIAERLGCLDQEGMALLRRGRAPTVKFGPYTGDKLSVDHIIPRSVAPELDAVLANLELMPAKLNMKKSAGVTSRQVALARSLRQAGLASDATVLRVEGALK